MADFQEVADSFKTIIDDIRGNPAQLFDRQTVEFSKAIAMHSVTRTDSQKEFATSVGEEFIIAKQLTLLDRKRILDAQLMTDLSGKVEESVRTELVVIEDLVMQNDRLLDSINSQVGAWGIAVGQTIQLNEFEERRAEIAAELMEIQLDRRNLTEEEIRLLNDRLDTLRDEDKVLAVQSARQREIVARQRLRNKQEEIFGISQEAVTDRMDEMGDLLSTTAGRITLIATALKILLTPIIRQMKELRDIGLTWSQTMEASADIIRSSMHIGLVRGLLTMRDTAEVTAAMRTNFADITFQSHELAAIASELTTAFKLSANESAELVEVLAKVGGLTDHAQEDMLHMAQAFGQINDIRPGALLQAAARHASVFARFGEEGAQAFFRSVTAAERLGIELSTIESTADSFLDIDTFFQNVSKLRTLGVDIADPFGLAQIAERGTPEELLAELQRQMQGVDLTTLGRTRRNALASAIGMDVADLSRLIQGQDVGRVDDVSAAQIDEFGGFAEGMGGAVDAMGAMVDGLGGIQTALNIIVGLLALRSIGGTGKVMGGLGRLLGLGRGAAAGALAGGAGTAGGVGTAIAGSSLATMLGGGALLAGGGFAAFKGTDMLQQAFGGRGVSEALATGREARSQDARGAMEDRRRAQIQADMQVSGKVSPAMMDTLTQGMRQAVEGVTVKSYMDSRLVTDQLVRGAGPARN